ncbi:acyl-CoA dehydrogenase [Novosphingobium sp. EMRT-2]|uniref:acyl-CoA dehydrogenase n=1 Tax=Novosphingobium sp. EMRT-2 TaxID=2571749 RepID=UPI0010BDB9DE|nr:acyl-CoA dehydrogenase [Novosphingobium sp. EMRT-2]QCI96128.1 acyl-CoA dehydrogenase [Novosphingobium sp. EMRT-2]
MSDILIAREELDFLLWEWLGLDRVLAESDDGGIDRESAGAILDLSAKLAANGFLPHYKLSDNREPELTASGVRALPEIGAALREYAELGLFSASLPPDRGGMGLPALLANASFAQFLAANVATAAYPMLTTANARLLLAFGTEAQIEAFALPQIAGRWFGTMCLSEPQAGSNLADVATRAVPDGQDALGTRYRLSGNKMWISGGDHDLSENIVHLVLARTVDDCGEQAAGTKGLSLFVVPKILPSGDRNDIAVAGLNHKMGYRGTTNCLLNFGEREGAIGWIVGAPGQGLPQMFKMMNEARIGVALGAAALGYRGWRHAVQYAGERLQGRPPGTAPGKSLPIVGHPDVRAMLLAGKCYAEGALALVLYCARLVDEESHDPDAAVLLGLLTPIAKTWASEYGLAANDIAIQVHGGYGYARDFDVEQLWRDNRLNPIHEGTTGIQGLDLAGRKLKDAAALALLRGRIDQTVAKAAQEPELAGLGRRLAKAWDRLGMAAEVLRASEPDVLASNATALLRAFGHGVAGWQWLDRALLCAGAGEDAPFRAGKVWACQYFFEREMPKIEVWIAPLLAGSALPAAIPAACL